MIEIYDMTVNHQFQPIGIDGDDIRFSWKIGSDEQDTFQLSYQILCSVGWFSWLGRCRGNHSLDDVSDLRRYKNPKEPVSVSKSMG